MRFDPGKIWPHPVLRPSQSGDDYPYAEFQVDIDVKSVENGAGIDLQVVFDLSDQSLLDLVEEDFALYVLLIRSPKTHFRRVIKQKSREIRKSFSTGELSGRVEITPLLICIKDIPAFRAEGWHEDFTEYSFDIKSGMVLAEDESKDYWIDTAIESSIGSIIECVPSKHLPYGCWKCDLEGDRIKIVLSEDDYNRFNLARERFNNHHDGQYLMNGLYLPALIWILLETDKDSHNYEQLRWFSSLNHRLQIIGCNELGCEGSTDRLVDAQKILEYPFIKMPMITNAEHDIV